MAVVGSSVVQYQIVNAQRDRLMTQFEKQPQIKRDLAHFTEAAPNLTSVDALLKDRRSLQVVLSAFQLEDQVDSRALLKQVMTQDPTDPASLSNRLNDPRYKKLAAAIYPLSQGTKVFATAASRDAIVSGYETNEFEKYQGEQIPGMREALFFKRNAGQLTSAIQILNNKVMTEVVRVSLGLPKEIAYLSAKKQAEVFAKRIDVEKFKDSGFVDRFINRYLINNDQLQNGTTGDSAVTGLFGGGSSGSGGLYSLLGKSSRGILA
jgi:hypothetical protein